jgi:DnaJ-class molecular chaperone
MPIKVGDIGTCIFSKHALDTLLINRDTVEITIPRNFDINDAMYIGGMFVGAEDIPVISDGELFIHHHTGSHIKFDNNGNLEIKAKKIDFTEL